MIFLDANPVIYLIENPLTYGPRITARVTILLESGERLAVSDLVRMECQVGSLKVNDPVRLAQYIAFFRSPDVSVLAVSSAVCDRAARIGRNTGSNLLIRFTSPQRSSMVVHSS